MRLWVFIFPLRCNFIQFEGYEGFERSYYTNSTHEQKIPFWYYFHSREKILFEFPHCDIHQAKSSRRMSCLGFSADGKCVYKALVVVEFSLTWTQCKFIRIINKDFELAHRCTFEILMREKSIEKIRGKWKLGQSFREKRFKFCSTVPAETNFWFVF